MLPFFVRTAVQKYKPEKHENPKIGKWQLGVCLSLIQVGGCADGRLSPPVTLGAARLGRRDKHTPKAAQYNQKARKQSDDGRGVAAEPLGVRPAHTVAPIFVFIPSFMACPSPPYLPLSLSGVCAFSCVSISRLPYMMRITVTRFSSFSAI